MQGDQVGLDDVLNPEMLDTLLSQPGVTERLIDYLPDELKTKVCSLSCIENCEMHQGEQHECTHRAYTS
jgi:hypothetical protein